jgi:hypothetical protein
VLAYDTGVYNLLTDRHRGIPRHRDHRIGVPGSRVREARQAGEEKGPDAPGVQERISRILTISGVDLAVLFLVIADMVFKPGS